MTGLQLIDSWNGGAFGICVGVNFLIFLVWLGGRLALAMVKP